jgi:hypothetical protein
MEREMYKALQRKLCTCGGGTAHIHYLLAHSPPAPAALAPAGAGAGREGGGAPRGGNERGSRGVGGGEEHVADSRDDDDDEDGDGDSTLLTNKTYTNGCENNSRR